MRKSIEQLREDFPTLVRQYLKLIYNYIYRLTGDAKEAEDLTQETFIKAWKNLKKYRPAENSAENFGTWLFAIARNTAIDWLRKKKHLIFSDFENEEGENILLETLADPEPLADEIIAQAENKKSLENLLNKIPFASREVLILHYNDHFTFDEIAKILKKPLNTVKSQHRRALISLRKLLKK